MLEQKTITVGGDDFVLEQLPATPGLKYAIQIGKIFGTMIAGGFDIKDFDEKKDILKQLNYPKMITGLLSQLDDESTPKLIKSMIRDSMKSPKFSDTWYETRFAGKFDDMMELVTEIIMINFGEALEVAKKKFREVPITRQKSSEESTAVNGSSPSENAESTGSPSGPSQPDT